ncbi:SusD/RagB family nutrient-binding outer membrane lipoprotein [Antarcticibacterium sp. 1MA-6-2]|uniref:SusD/RagB family nutrient-binding outer membrane lipoprotein n=1 Tax=Antarcticibacterium sp. 1MA-6-2 TaxID=2908210 RepID=UPI001F2DB866|nr:SusD/RagB family nutrient-binding outer membrane lipoprotein [Antarcticibacterium sp. 1MA-6-2]UJH90979.1 SusD/RagB family nutrient-binding outer membrane lipoprotein [Antarcticibacterium sp. 1MA-6-2]
MKNRYIILMLLCSTVLGCDNFDDEININPNQPSEASGTQLIAQAQLSLPGLSSSPQGEFLAQYLAETQYVGASLYPQGSTSFYGFYQGPLIALQEVIDAEELNATQGPPSNQKAVAKILKAYFFWNITDRWGDVPYFQALQGTDNFTPVYDTQEEIYNDLFQELKEANDMMVSGEISDDIIYGGDMENWRKLANSVRLLMALRLSEVDEDKARTEFNDALEDGVFTSNDDNLVFQHLADANNQSYWYGQVVNQNREWWALTQNLVEMMKPVEDPRLPVYGDPARESGEFVGRPYGQEDNLGVDKESLLGSDIIVQDLAIHLVTHAQVLFALAEAAERGWITGDTEEYYNEAVTRSILQWTGSTEGAETLLNTPEVSFNPDNAMEQIAEQRYIHLFMHGYEAWSEWRRTGFPDNLVQPNGLAIPLRLAYPDNEAFNNAENYNAAVERLGGENSLYAPVWWDEN